MIERACVGDLAEQIRGVTYAKEDASSVPLPTHLPILRAGNISDSGLTLANLVYVPIHRISDRQRLRKHDVVVAASSGSLDVVGKTGQLVDEFTGSFGAFCKVLRPRDRVDPRYFGHFFRTPDYRRKISALAAGANINNLRGEHLDDLDMPLPTIEKQRRIADILDRADSLRFKRREALTYLDDLTQSIFLDMFGDTESGRWEMVAIENLISETRIGLVRSSAEFGAKYSTPYVRMNAITRAGELDLSDIQKTDVSSSELAAYSLHAGDLLFNTRNSRELVGKSALIPKGLSAVFNNNIMRVRFTTAVSPSYVARFLLSLDPPGRFLRRAERAG